MLRKSGFSEHVKATSLCFSYAEFARSSNATSVSEFSASTDGRLRNAETAPEIA